MASSWHSTVEPPLTKPTLKGRTGSRLEFKTGAGAAEGGGNAKWREHRSVGDAAADDRTAPRGERVSPRIRRANIAQRSVGDKTRAERPSDRWHNEAEDDGGS